MFEKGKISSFQMALMMNPTILATGILLLPSITSLKAERDMWISPFWGSLIGFIIVWIAYKLYKEYPTMTIIEYSENIVGRIPGKIIGFFFLFYYLHTSGVIVREYGEFVTGNFLLKTPPIVIFSSMVMVCAFSVRGGLEVIARSAQVFIPIVILLWFIIVVFLLGELDVKNMLPIFERGLMPSIMGSPAIIAWFSEYLLIAFMLPYLSDPEKGLKWGNFSVISVLVIMVITNLVTLLLFGDTVSDYLYPVMKAGKYISIADFFEHLESVIMAIWIAGTFIKISVFYYAIVLGTAQWLQLSDYKFLVFPLGILLTIFSEWVAPNLFELKNVLGGSYGIYSFFIQIIIPAFLLGLALLRKKLQSQRGTKHEQMS